MARNSYLIVNEALLSRLVVNDALISSLLQGRDLRSNPFAEALQRKEARKVVISAVASGILSRSRECSNCHCFCNTQGHHEDYWKPLEVQWLCPKCHNRADRARRLRDDPGYANGDSFAAFLLVHGEVTLPFAYDPPDDGCNVDYRTIRSLYFAGFACQIQARGDHQYHKLIEYALSIRTRRNRSATAPMVGAVLSCGHHDLICPSALSEVPTVKHCHECSDIREERAERRRAARRRIA